MTTDPNAPPKRSPLYTSPAAEHNKRILDRQLGVDKDGAHRIHNRLDEPKQEAPKRHRGRGR